MKNSIYILLAIAAAASVSCHKEPYNTEKSVTAQPFNGTVETDCDVDLGLKARWAGYNVGASSPEQYGAYYSWGETSSKDEYLETTYDYFPSGTVLCGDTDVASRVMGYGFQMPDEEDVKELIDNCDFNFCSYNGVNGWVATSRVQGYEGKSIFFPAAGYAAGTNINYQGSYAVFWTTGLAPGTNKRAVNAFFEGSSLNLNAPPKGTGGLTWCGYTVRAVRKFLLSLGSSEANVSGDNTSVAFSIIGNASWTASVSGTGTSVQPGSGIGDDEVTVSFPANTTEETRKYIVTVSSPDIANPLIFTVNHFGVTPDFGIDGDTSETIGWDCTTASCALKASSSVSWTASVTCGGKPVPGSSVTPSNGTGSVSSVSIILPTSADMRNETVYSVNFTTADPRIPDALATVSYEVHQAPTPYVPFSDTNVLMDDNFYSKLIQSCTGTASPYTLDTSVEVDHITVTPSSGKTCLVYIAADNYITKKGRISFTSASAGDAILVLYCSIVKKTTSNKMISLSWTDKNGGKKEVPAEVTAALTNSTDSNIYYTKDSNALQLALPGVEVGDVFTFIMSDSDSHRIYRFYFKEDKSKTSFGNPGEAGPGGNVDVYRDTL